MTYFELLELRLTMTYFEFLDLVINKGIAAAKRDYATSRHKVRLEGSLAGFETCRNKKPSFLKELLAQAKRRHVCGHMTHNWYHSGFRNEVEWVCNCVSVWEINEGRAGIIIPTARALITVNEIMKENNGNINLCAWLPGSAQRIKKEG